MDCVRSRAYLYRDARLRALLCAHCDLTGIDLHARCYIYMLLGYVPSSFAHKASLGAAAATRHSLALNPPPRHIAITAAAKRAACARASRIYNTHVVGNAPSNTINMYICAYEYSPNDGGARAEPLFLMAFSYYRRIFMDRRAAPCRVCVSVC